MTSAYTTYRESLVSTLTAGLSGYEWQAGPPPSARAVPEADAWAYVWITRAAPLSGNKLVEQITAGVRLYVVWGQQADQSVPVDPTTLEQAAEDLQTTLAPAQAPGDPWFYEVQTITFNYAEGFVDAVVVGTRWNDFAVS